MSRTPLNTVWMSRAEEDGSIAEVGLLRSTEWMSANGIYAEGDIVRLSMPEMGAEGEFEVISIEGSAIEAGGSGVVTGCFRFSRGVICDLRIEGESEVIGVTGLHPIWSEDRQDWIPAGELRVGERLQRVDGGTAVLMESHLRPQVEPVFNIEVEGDHCYRVGKQGVLVHNTSTDECANYKVVDFGPAGAHYETTAVHVGGRDYNQPKLVVARLMIQSDGSPASPGATNFVQNVIGFKRSASHIGPTDEVGHLIGQQFGGKAALAATVVLGNGNFIPQDPADNDAFQKIEETIAKILKKDSCADICVKIAITYDAASAGAIMPVRPYRPWEIRYQWWQAGQPKGNKLFTNGWSKP